MRYFKSLLVGLLVAGAQAHAGYVDYEVQYEKPVNLPSCDSNNAKVKIIDSNSDWSAINDSAYQVFCVKPGDYSGKGLININRGGSQSAKRYIRYYSGNDSGKMPWDQSVSERAIIKGLNFDGANWWVVDRITVTDPKYSLNAPLLKVTSKSANNVFNRMLFEKNKDVLVRINNGSKNTTVQNSVLRKTKLNNSALYSCIYIAVKDSDGPTVNPHIVNNEIYDCGEDGIQTNSNTKLNNPQYGIHGLVVENNDIYITPDMYTDGSGNMNRNGPYACAENALDIKVATFKSQPNEDQVARILHNRIWGFRITEPDTGLCNQNGSPAAPAVVFHFGTTTDVLFQYNIIFDSENGIWVSKNGPKRISLVGNILYDVSNKTNPRSAIDLDNGVAVEAYYNLVAKTSQYMNGGGSKADIRNNMFVRAGRFGSGDFGSESTMGHNIYYSTTAYDGKKGIGGDLKDSNVSDAKNKDFCFDYKLHTGLENMCIPDILPTPDSPYLKGEFTNTGDRGGIGIDDTMWIQNIEWDILSGGAYPPNPPQLW